MKNDEPKALKEVWELKEKAYREVEEMNLRDALKERIKRSSDTTQVLGFNFVRRRRLITAIRHE